MELRTHYRETVEGLFGRRLTAADRTPAGEIEAAERRLGVRLPAALRDYYAELGGFRQLNEAHNRLLGPAELELRGDVLRFMDENQVVCFWGVRRGDLGEPDPTVYQGNPDGPAWHSEELCLSEFLTLMIYLQAVWDGLPHVGDHMDAEDVLKVIEPTWEKVVDHQDLRIWRHGGKLISHLDGDSICIGSAATAEELSYLERTLGFAEQ